jgi:hypothetical protein
MIINGFTFLNQHFDGGAHSPRNHDYRVFLRLVSSFFRLYYLASDQAHVCLCIVAYLLKARTADPEKQLLLANGSETFVSRQRQRNNGTTAVDRL